ncbi:hypothetical protein B9Z55_007459 [Caenorhabditis nigoni]|uniref:BTB domain-containing protein n=1 Tax=Caenorhabditis nigoni TaxID=1611254 RepID=A0A2G5V9R1_9PELO|nr:hypothetical protein B9Z55_007459 [Caenorhabditis nigoni]
MYVQKRELVIRRDVNVQEMVKYEIYTVTERHFGAPWTMKYSRSGDHFDFCVDVNVQTNTKWIIKTENTLKLISANGTVSSIKENCEYKHSNMINSWGWDDFIRWATLVNDYMVDGKVTIEAHVVIKEMIGFGKAKLMKFDESVAEFSDIALIVNDRKFYLSKYFLAHQSSYFKTLLFGKFDESAKSEIKLNGIEADDFQNFLELIHGESSIDDDTVAGILHLADMYDVQTAIKKCEEYLLKNSQKKIPQKLQISLRYNLENLKSKCLSKITTISDIQSIVTLKFKEMDLSTMETLLQKSLDFSNK